MSAADMDAARSGGSKPAIIGTRGLAAADGPNSERLARLDVERVVDGHHAAVERFRHLLSLMAEVIAPQDLGDAGVDVVLARVVPFQSGCMGVPPWPAW